MKNYLNLFCCCITILFTTTAVFTQNALPAQKIKQLEAFVEKAMKDWNAPAAGIGIVKGDQVVYCKGFGYRNVEKQLKADENTLFAIGSSSKAFTALGVLQLADDGLLETDKPLIEYLPDFRMMDDYVTRHMTATDLLCHRSGLPRHDLLWYGSDDTREEMFRKLRYLEPSAGFREVFQYQNLMFMTAGLLTGRLRNSTWEAEIAKRILQPLGMERTNFSVEASKEDSNHALPYSEEKKQLKVIPFRNIDAVGPAGSINSSPREMCNWLIMQLNGGKFNDQQVISENGLKLSHSSAMVVSEAWNSFLAYDNGNTPVSYGLGWFVAAHSGHRQIEHGGTIDGFRASVGLLPDDKIGVVVLVNKSGSSLPQILRNYVYDLMLDLEPTDWNGKLLEQREKALAEQDKQKPEADKQQVKGTQPSHALDKYAGKYDHPAYGMVEITLKSDTLRLGFHNLEMPLHHYHYDVFQTDDPMFGKNKIAFHSNMMGEIEKLSTILEPAVDEIVFERSPEPIELSTEKLDAFTGDYELSGANIKVWREAENSLMLRVPGQPDYTLIPEKENGFYIKGLNGYRVVFESVAGKVDAVVFYQPNGVFTAQKK